jgi:hypothetical protein
MDDVSGSNRRILPHNDTQIVQEVPQTLISRETMAVSMPPFRSVNSATSFHESHAHDWKLPENQGVIIHLYLDDWLLRSNSREVNVQTKNLLRLLPRLRIKANLKKSLLTPSQKFVFLGYRYDLQIGLVFPTQEAIEKLKLMLQQLICRLEGFPFSSGCP